MAVLDADGNTVATNRPWEEFARQHQLRETLGGDGVAHLEDADGVAVEDAARATAGIAATLDGDRDQFEFEYPSKAADRTRWFRMRVQSSIHEDERYLTVSHTDITERRTRETTFRSAYEITTRNGESFDQKITALLEVVRQAIGTTYATFSHIDGSDYVFEAVAAATGEDLEAGETVPVEELPNCKHVFDTGDPLVLDDVAAQAPALADPTWGIAAYLGAPVTVDGKPYGTFCFYSTEPRDAAFTEWEVTLVELLGDWISYELGRRERTQKLRHLKENLSDVVWMSTPDKDEIEFVSDSYEAVWGRPTESLREEPTSFVEAIHPEDRDRVSRALADQRTQPDAYETEYRIVRPDGSVRWIHDEAVGVQTDGELERIIGIATDVTERVEHERELAYQTALLEAQTETTIDGLLLVDTDRSVRYHNNRFLDIWDLSAETVSAQSGEQLLEQVRDRLAEPDEFMRGVERLHANPTEQSRDTIELTDGRWLDRYSAPVIGYDGTHYGRLWVFRDITERIEHEMTLERQHDRLAQLQRVNDIVRKTIQALQDTKTRKEIEAEVCAKLTETNLYQAAWIAGKAETPTGEVTIDVRTAVGVEDSYFEDISEPPAGPAQKAIQTGTVQVVDDVSTSESFPAVRRETALAHDHQTLAAIPLAKADLTYGALVVYAPPTHTISETEQDVLADLGRSIALAIQRVHSQCSLSAATLVSLSFRIPDSEFVFGTVSEDLDCELTLERRIAGQRGEMIYYVTVDGGDPATVCDRLAADPLITTCRIVRDGTTAKRAMLEAHLNEECQVPLDILTDYGGSIRDARAADGDISIRAELPSEVDISTLYADLQSVAPSIELVSKRHVDRPARTAAELRNRVTEQLTEKQRSALKATYARGYYAWPRESTLEEISETFDISGPTMHYRLRKAQETVIGSVLEGTDI
ncbi:bacterio-opsin activator domain-containing protein [Halobellus salinisoli]|uniref:bacterio-opsin activator domain-containing protein n=1 Tax=Halobellus salinisoli TaxID=3108500 RepID=UPI00300949B8